MKAMSGEPQSEASRKSVCQARGSPQFCSWDVRENASDSAKDDGVTIERREHGLAKFLGQIV